MTVVVLSGAQTTEGTNGTESGRASRRYKNDEEEVELRGVYLCLDGQVRHIR